MKKSIISSFTRKAARVLLENYLKEGDANMNHSSLTKLLDKQTVQKALILGLLHLVLPTRLVQEEKD